MSKWKKPKYESKQARVVRLLKNKAWILLKEYVRQRDPACVTCGKGGDYKEAHVGHLKHGYLDFNLKNLNRQCSLCNLYHHGRLDVYADYLNNKYGYGTTEELERLKNEEQMKTKKAVYTEEVMKGIIAGLEELIKQLNARC